jgi:hypothetical protein
VCCGMLWDKASQKTESTATISALPDAVVPLTECTQTEPHLWQDTEQLRRLHELAALAVVPAGPCCAGDQWICVSLCVAATLLISNSWSDHPMTGSDV